MSGNQASGRRMTDAGKRKNNMSIPQWGGHNNRLWLNYQSEKGTNNQQ